MLVGVEAYRSHLAEKLPERRVAAQVTAQRQRVDEQSDERLKLGSVRLATGVRPRCRRCRSAGEKNLEDRGEHHEQGGAFGPA